MYQFRNWTRILDVLHELFGLHLHVRAHPNKSQLRLPNSGCAYKHSVHNLLFSHLRSKALNTKVKRKPRLLYQMLVTLT